MSIYTIKTYGVKPYLFQIVFPPKTIGTANVAPSLLPVFPYALYLFA